MNTIPLQATPAQTLRVTLDGLNLAITLQTLRGALYATVDCNGVPVCAGRRIRDRVVITERARELGFPRLRLFMADLRGTDDPAWPDLGTRFMLFNATPT